MKKNLLTLCMAAMSVIISMPVIASDDIYMVKQEGSGKVVHNFYNADNNIVRSSDVDESMVTPLYQYFYTYTEDGLLVEDYYTQWKDAGVWTDPRDKMVYTYDEQDRLSTAENTMTNRKKFYTYNENGYLYQIVDMGKNYGSTEYDKTYSTTTYLDFDENGNPAKAQYDDGLYASGCYDEYYTYDEKGRMLSKASYKLDGTPKNKYEYTYNDYDIVMTSYKSVNDGNGGFEYSSRSVRTDVGNNQYEFKYEEYWNDWVTHDSYTEFYSELKSEYAPRNLVLTDVTTAENPNAIELVCDVPVTEVPNALYIVWRDWQPVDTVAAVDGVITYAESGVANDVREYFIQSYDAVNDVLYNVSNIAPVAFNTVLPAVAELRYLETIEGFSVDGQGSQMPAYFVKFEWDAPETNLNILGYKIYDVLSFGEGFDNFYIELKETQSTVDSVSVFRENSYDSPDQQKAITVMVTVLYELGESEGIIETFPVENPNAAVEGVHAERLAYVAGDNLVMADNAQVVIYNTAGAMVATYKNVKNINLVNLPAGAYIACVKVGKATQTFKIARR